MKNKITTLLAIFLFVLPISAADLNEPNSLDKPQTVNQQKRLEKNYHPYPNPDRGYVTDNAQILTVDQEAELESWLYTTEKHTNVEIVVVTIKSMSDYPGTDNATIERFATGLFNTYRIGNMPENDGVLLVVSLGDRKARIELGKAYGTYKNSDAARIMQKKIIPSFKKNQYDAGIFKGVRAIMKEFANVTIWPMWSYVALIAAIPILILIIISLFRNGKRGWGWICVGLLIIVIIFLLRMSWKVIESLPADSDAGGFGGGFGSGSSGGGGATGSW